MPIFRSLSALFLSVTAFASVAFTQQVTLSRINFEGDATYSQQELLAAAGLKLGPSTQQSVQDAARRLNDTGLFEEVNFAAQGAVLTYTLKPATASSMFPVKFSNFVWWNDRELDSALRKRIPLYRADQLPPAGSVHDAVVEALKDLLITKGIPTPAVISLLVTSRPGGKPDAQAFQITSPSIRVHSFVLQQSSPAMQSILKNPIAELTGQTWDETSFASTLSSAEPTATRDISTSPSHSFSTPHPQFRTAASMST